MIITLFILALISFFVDVTTLYIYGYHATSMLLCVYLYTLIYLPHQWLLLGSIGCLLYTQDVVIFGHAGIQLLYLLPLTVLSYALSRVMYPNRYQLVITAVAAGALQALFIKRFLQGYHIDGCYTVETIYGILIGIFLISLIVRLSGLLGNRIRV